MKKRQIMRNKENIGHIVRRKPSITRLVLTYKISTLLIHHLSREAEKDNNIFIYLINNFLISNKVIINYL